MGILKKAENQMAYFKAGILGFPGSGKTFTATLLAEGICKAIGNMRVAYFDTETGSDFLLKRLRTAGIEVFQVKSRAFGDLLATIQECEKENIPVLIADSITHVWRDLCESYDKKLNRKGRLQFQDWAVIKGEWRKYTDLYVNGRVHIIVCGRAGYEYDYDFNEDGTKDLIKTDIKMKVEGEFGFEPSLVIQMERTSETKEDIRAHLGKTDRKSKDAKQQHRPEVGSKWIHRAYVLKDRTDTLNGQQFDYPTFKDFLPHFQALNIGGEHLGVDTSRTSEDRFNADGKPTWKADQERAAILLEMIEAEFTRFMPGQTTTEKRAKINLVEHVFGTTAWLEVKAMGWEALKTGLDYLKQLTAIPENTAEALANKQFSEPKAPEDPFSDVPIAKPQSTANETHDESTE